MASIKTKGSVTDWVDELAATELSPQSQRHALETSRATPERPSDSPRTWVYSKR